jgi:nucleotide-binding universal stress UspA family protein
MMKSKGEAVLADGKKLAEAEGVSVDTLLLEGDIVNAIAKTAKEGSYDLIVVGARGLSKLEELMLGSVSQGIVKNAPCPVIVTR